VSPTAVQSMRKLALIFPTTTGPVFIPIRTASVAVAAPAISACRSRTPRWMLSESPDKPVAANIVDDVIAEFRNVHSTTVGVAHDQRNVERHRSSATTSCPRPFQWVPSRW
jgi:hypothetical protein